jgi:transposase-like protein
LSSPRLLETWVRAYRLEGADALRPKPKGRPRKPDAPPPAELPELERLRRENERLRAEVAYLGKLRALRAQDRR